jgi:deoxyribodipyrimidine photo-lyase
LKTENTAITIFWFRRDLRLEDNHGFYRALRQPYPVLPVFIFDTLILKDLSDRRDKRVAFIHQQLVELSRTLQKWRSALYIIHAEPSNAFRQLLASFNVAQVIANEDYEPYAIARDKKVGEMLASKGIPFQTFTDQVVFDPAGIEKADGTPYQVYTPYSKEWKRRLVNAPPASYPSEKHLDRLQQLAAIPLPSLQELGFEAVEPGVAPLQLSQELLRDYAETRNLPSFLGTSHASPHLRFGTVSIRYLVTLALKWSDAWLNELIWREFFMMILYHFPQVVDRAFRAQYDKIEWRNNESEFTAWAAGNTGYPLVDAGMRQLNERAGCITGCEWWWQAS